MGNSWKEKFENVWPSEVDKDSPIPLYYQIEYVLEREIRNGNFEPDEKLPTEKELCEFFGVSRSVVRQAIKGLKDKRLVWRSPGKGTFVSASRYNFPILERFTGFFQAVESAGDLPRSQLLEKRTINVSGKIAQALHIPEKSPAFFIRRLRFVDDQPFLISRTYLPMSRIPDQLLGEDLENQSLYRILEEKYGYELSYSQRALEAVLASREQARLLNINRGDSLILTHSVTYYKSGAPFEYDVGFYRGDRAQFEIKIFRDSEEKLKLYLSD